MSRLSELLDRATPRPWEATQDTFYTGRVVLHMVARTADGNSFDMSFPNSMAADRDLFLALVNNAEAIQRLWEAAEELPEVAVTRDMHQAREALRHLCGEAK